MRDHARMLAATLTLQRFCRAKNQRLLYVSHRDRAREAIAIEAAAVVAVAAATRVQAAWRGHHQRGTFVMMRDQARMLAATLTLQRLRRAAIAKARFANVRL
jgi:hypothetical protein